MSIKNISRNKWRVVVKIGEVDGKPKYLDRIINGTKQEAIDFEASHTLNKHSSSNMTVRAYIYDVWLKSLDCEKNSIEYFRRGVDSVMDCLGHIKLNELSTYSIEQAILSLSKGSVRRRAIKSLSVAFKAAKRWKMLSYNPMEDVNVPTGEGTTKLVEAYTAEEVSEILDLFYGDVLEPAIIIMAYNGKRKQDVLALNWQDIDLKTGAVRIDKAFTAAEHKPVEKGTKDGDSEIIYLQGYAHERIEELGKDRIGPIVPVNGKRIHPSVARKRFERIVKRAGMRYLPISKLRHSAATIALGAGVDVAVVSKMLRHKRVSTTENYYLKPLQSAKIEAGKTLADAIGKGQKDVSGEGKVSGGSAC